MEKVDLDELALRERIREISREEVASLCGLMLRRLQDEGPTRVQEHNLLIGMQSKMWGEALRDFGGTTLEPGTE